MFETLRRSFDVGIFNLNYDTAALTAMPGAYTGFGDDGAFNPHEVHARTEWNYVYHLHGSVHHSLNQANLGQICWRNDLLAEGFVDGDGGIGPDLRSEGRLFPKTTLLAGGFKLDQLLVEPFHSFHAALIRHVYAADAILIGGYGFGDAHVNRALHNRVSSLDGRPPVLILDKRSIKTPLTENDHRWVIDLCKKAMSTDGSFFHDVGGGSFEEDKEHRIALCPGGFAEGASRVEWIVAWLSGASDHVLKTAH